MSKTLDLKTELNRMVQERRGASDDMLLVGSYKDLNTLKNDLQDMIKIRSGNIKLNRRTCQTHVGTICTEHLYTSYSDITDKTTIQDALSVGDIDLALNKLSYCTCDARQASVGCICHSNTLKDYCTCHARTTNPCDCRNRNAGKYNHYRDCTCNNRTVESCSCEGRSATNSCTCEGRCSCNAQKYFSMIPPDNSCTCDSRIETGCSCDTVTIARECTYNYCTCVSRSSTCSCDVKTWVTAVCAARANWDYCDNHCSSVYCSHKSGWGKYTETCTCKSRTGQCTCNLNMECYGHIRQFTVCDNNINPNYYYNVSACMCKNRCSCNAKSFYK